MAAKKDEEQAEAPPQSSASPYAADDPVVKKGERTGVARGPDEDATFHVYEFEK